MVWGVSAKLLFARVNCRLFEIWRSWKRKIPINCSTCFTMICECDKIRPDRLFMITSTSTLSILNFSRKMKAFYHPISHVSANVNSAKVPINCTTTQSTFIDFIRSLFEAVCCTCWITSGVRQQRHWLTPKIKNWMLDANERNINKIYGFNWFSFNFVFIIFSVNWGTL